MEKKKEKKGKIELKIHGKKIVFKTKELKIIDVNEDMKNIASQIAYWGNVLAKAKQERMSAEAYYENWRAGEVKILIDRDKKFSEWKATANVKARQMHFKLKEAIALAEHNLQASESIYEAFKTKAFLLPSKGARDRDVMNTIGMKTKKK